MPEPKRARKAAPKATDMEPPAKGKAAKGKGKAVAPLDAVKAALEGLGALPSAVVLSEQVDSADLTKLVSGLERALSKARQASKDAARRSQLAVASSGVMGGLLDEEGGGVLGSLPSDIVLAILRQIDTKRLCQLACVNKAWRAMLSRPEPFTSIIMNSKWFQKTKITTATQLKELLQQPRFRLVSKFVLPGGIAVGPQLVNAIKKALPGLRELDLSNVENKMDQKSLDAFSTFTGLTSLKLGEPKYNTNFLQPLRVFIKNNPELEEFEYGSVLGHMNFWTNSAMDALADAKKLKTVSLHSAGRYCTVASAHALMRSLPKLEKFWLWSMSIDVDAFMAGLPEDPGTGKDASGNWPKRISWLLYDSKVVSGYCAQLYVAPAKGQEAGGSGGS